MICEAEIVYNLNKLKTITMSYIEPICISHYFVNKQNVRSFGNCVKLKLLKTEDLTFAQHVLQDESLVKEAPSLIYILNNLKNNLKIKSRLDFRNYFSEITKINFLTPISKTNIFNCCSNALHQILPNNLFGNNHNARIFRRLLKTVVFCMRRQNMILSKFVQNWDITVSPWNSLPNDKMKLTLCNILHWILRYILSPILCLNFYVTTCKFDADENKLHFFWKNQWQSFYDKQISKMVYIKSLKKCDPYCLGKRMKYNRSLQEILKLKEMKREIPKLHLILKINNDCRPIVRYKQDTQTPGDKYRMKERLFFLKTLTGKQHGRIEIQFNNLFKEWVNQDKPKLYFVKTDLSNAFGSINREKLMKILSERHSTFQKMEKNLNIKKKIAQQYKDMITELRKPLLVRAGSTVYEWKDGLVQGYRYSPALSELYYTHLDEIYFANHFRELNSPLKLFIRVVDDYLYVTNSIDDAFLFLEALSNYRNVNYEKTVVNFTHPHIKWSNEICFLGYSYDTTTLQVSRASNVYAGQMCYKIYFSSAIANLHKFLENRIGQSGISVNGHIFNLHHNTEELIWNHVFTTLCLSANKFCTILATLCEPNEMVNYLPLYKKRVAVKLCNSILETIKRNKHDGFIFMYCINHFRYLAFKALILCVKQTSKCSILASKVNDELTKCNCLFGKWKEHSSRMDGNGKSRQLAVREICKRADLKKIIKNFETLPSGFQCYKNSFS